MKTTITCGIVFAALMAASQGVIVFSETFGTLSNGSNISVSNTSLTYVRIGTGGGSIVASNPSTVGDGSSVVITGPTNTSLNGIGVGSTLNFNGASALSFEVDFSISDAAGDVVFGLGSGTTFTGNSAFSTTQGLFWIQVDGTNLERRTSSSWVDVGGATPTTLTLGTLYNLLVEVDVSAGLMDISLNGALIDDNVSVTTSSVTAPTGFRIYSVSGSDVEVDNIVVTAVPEPAAAVLGSFGLLGLLRRRRI